MKFPNPLKRPPAPPAFGTGKVIPEDSASIPSRIIFQWISPLLDVGYSRPLEPDDLWELPHGRLTSTITDELDKNFYGRCPPEKRPRYMREADAAVEKGVHENGNGTKKEDVDADGDGDEKGSVDVEKATERKSKPKKYDESLPKAIHWTFRKEIWMAGVFKLIGDTLKTTTPLLSRVLLDWLVKSYVYHRMTEAQRAASGTPQPQGIGYGIGIAFGIFAMQQVSSLTTNHFFQIAMINGLAIRTGIIGSVLRKSLRLTGRARAEHSIGQITNIVSTDATRLDRFAMFGHNLYIAPIQLAIGIGLLIGTLGYSALVGLGVLILGFPLQFYFVRIIFTQRKKGVKITDKRVRLTTEVLQGIRLIKYYAWERFYVEQISELRSREVRTVMIAAMARSFLFALVVFMPILASILSFITYSLSGHNLDVAIIFSSLQLFNIIRMPLIMFPFVLSGLSDALVALRRISTLLTAEDLPDAYPIEGTSGEAVHVDGDFVWETVLRGEGDEKGGKFAVGKGSEGKKGDKKKKKNKKNGVLPVTNDDVAEEKEEKGDNEQKDGGSEEGKSDESADKEKPFELTGLKLVVPKGAFVAIVGRVGSGKSSVLQALIGEMRKTRGSVTFGGNVSYAPQTPWIRNATLRDNVLFGQPDDEERFRNVIKACSLEHDLEVLPQGEKTEIGEKGINLSGGQKARVSLARAAYSNADVVLLDDPLSAVDAYVGKSILQKCLLNGPLADRTRILVTHSIHVLDKVDYIYVMDNGKIIEQGTYDDLVSQSPVFSRLIEEYGNQDSDSDSEAGSSSDPLAPGSPRSPKHEGPQLAFLSAEAKKAQEEQEQKALMQDEERNTGSVTWALYRKYMEYAGTQVWIPTILLLLILSQVAQVSNTLFLGFWTGQSIHGFRQGEYMAVYSALGVAQAIFTFLFSFGTALAVLMGGLNMFKVALNAVLRSPTSFFDTTPMGRILSRLSKDQDTIDNELALTLTQVMNSLTAVLGTVALVFYTFPYLGIIFLPMTLLYLLVSTFYRKTSVETKRLDSLLRSILYAAFSETLTGLATIRAYREQKRSIQNAEYGLDMENRAYYLTISIQRWLSVRLDLFGNVLILGIGLFAAGYRNTIDPSRIAVVLTYSLAITQIFSEMVSQFAQNEQNMNAVERIQHYAELPPEGDATKPDDPPPSWPSEGRIAFRDVELAYREGLPLVLKQVTFDVKAGEKVGIVGRTGAGKSSLLQALFRTVELQGGSIEIDDRDISKIGLESLRNRLALVPQDSTLFLGTLRDNLDPQNLRTDAELISVLQRAWLLPKDGRSDPVAEAKFSLDSVVGDDGSNFSSGEKQLLALCRALVKNSRVIILDEATSSVDVETDAKLQKTIQAEFASSTLLCIAHRLNTIAYYDRILVMDKGKVAEYDTVLGLYDKEDSIFRSLCDEANLQRADIVRIRSEQGPAPP